MKTRLSLRKRLALELNRQLQDKLTAEHPLRQLFWECTLRCNLHCRHCGSDCRQESQVEDMPLETFLPVLDGIAARQDPHKTFVIITGGEPLVRDDLERCGRAIYDRGFPWGLVTNGLLLTAARFRRLMAAGLHTVTVSLDGLEDNHNWMRRHHHSFERVDQAIDVLVKEPAILYDIVTCVTRRNYAELPALREYLTGKGVKRWRLLTVFPVGRAAEDRELQLSDEHFLGLMEFIKATRLEGRIRADYGCEGFLGEYELDVRDTTFFCKAGIAVGSVLADGSISACSSIRSDYHQGNILRDDFMDVWEHRFDIFRHHEWKRQGLCADCNMFRYCCGNGMHLRDGDGRLLLCHLQKLHGTGRGQRAEDIDKTQQHS